MAINEWWAGDNRERFWVEITNRQPLGENLIAPQLDDGGREYWSYTLVNHVRPRDVVLHWSKNGEPGVVGYSHVAETPFPSTLEWQSRGTYGRSRESTGEEDAWEAPLAGYRELAAPLTQTRLRVIEKEIRAARADLQATHDGVLYFPFALSELTPHSGGAGLPREVPRGTDRLDT